MNLSVKDRILCTFVLILGFLGFKYQIECLYDGVENPERFGEFLRAISLTLIYIVPFVLFIRFLVRRWDIDKNAVWLTTAISLTAVVNLGSLGNEWLSRFWLLIDKEEAFIYEWGASLTAPFAEEIAKGFMVLLVFLLVKKMNLRTAFVLSFIAGLCFQIPEDILYTHGAVFAENASGDMLILERICYAFVTHSVFSALFGTGLMALVLRVREVGVLKPLFWIFSAVAIHFVWNSPLEIKWISEILGVVGIVIVSGVFFLLDSEIDKPVPATENEIEMT